MVFGLGVGFGFHGSGIWHYHILSRDLLHRNISATIVDYRGERERDIKIGIPEWKLFLCLFKPLEIFS